MMARILSGEAPGGKRTPLAEVLPLATPFVVQIFPIYACNFRCNYCFHSVPVKERGFVADWPVMKFDLYKKCVDELAGFAEPLKVLRFVGMGEPLLHKEIAAMIGYAVERKVARKVELLTNGSLLTPEMSDELIAAGLSRLVISVQGLSTAKYRQISHVDLDFVRYVENIAYFYRHKTDTDVYIKVVDHALDATETPERFYEIFGEVCDSMAVETAVPIMPGVDYDKVLEDPAGSRTQFGLDLAPISVCPQPFFTMQVNPDGKVVPCYQIDYPEIMGDVNRETMQEIWNGATYKRFRLAMLDGREQVGAVCDRCNFIKYRLFPEDDLQSVATRLKEAYR